MSSKECPIAKFRIPLTLRGRGDPRARQELFALWRLPRSLRAMLDEALAATNSTGCTVWELERLYRSILRERPSNAIEFGSGISTLVIAAAVRELAERGHRTRFVSVEQSADYQKNMLAWFPDELKPSVEFLLSPTEAIPWPGGRIGYRYRDTPRERFDWVFVDGPQLPRKDPALFDSDVLYLPRGHRMVIHVDGRRSTVEQLGAELQPTSVERFPAHHWTTLCCEVRDPYEVGTAS